MLFFLGRRLLHLVPHELHCATIVRPSSVARDGRSAMDLGVLPFLYSTSQVEGLTPGRPTRAKGR